MKLLILILLAAVVVSLASGLVFLTRDREDSGRLLKALKVRVSLSILLIVVLVVSYFQGWISAGASI